MVRDISLADPYALRLAPGLGERDAAPVRRALEHATRRSPADQVELSSPPQSDSPPPTLGDEEIELQLSPEKLRALVSGDDGGR